jgi:hypothetical protein
VFCLLDAGFLLGLPFNLEDGGEMSVDFHTEVHGVISQESSNSIRIAAIRNSDILGNKAVRNHDGR